MATGFVIFCAGDYTCQSIVEKKPKVDWKRNLIHTLVCGLWFNPGDQFYMSVIGPKLFKSLFVRGFMHEVILTPILIPAFLYMSSFLKNFSHQEGLTNLKAKWFNSCAAVLPYWCFVNTFSYLYVPFHLRMLVINFFSFIAAVGLSFYNNRYKINNL